ncbi:hypothetical protein E8E12_004639 [Didymella heteroderae]|uniref:DUF7907 domain-containing protein n=1 Tax=Didymella heteroderae TaxID=1769908 RepID=A0A9P4WKC9_9PLEO|nr:hypothetical protein E8E12_004639 [Didymella heteroderae]
MKLSNVIFAALFTVTKAQNGYWDVPSPGFRLVVRSSNSTYNGTALGACHQGAAIEGLCVTDQTVQDPPSSYTTFYHNVSSARNEAAGATGIDGLISWTLRAGGNFTVPSAMFLALDSTSNVANPTFYPGTDKSTLVAFEEDGCLYIQADRDDTVSPPTYFNPSRKVKNWHVCLTRYSYTYTTLSWKVGLTGTPQNPSCQKVDVVRVYN